MPTVVLGVRREDKVGELQAEEEVVAGRLTPYQGAGGGDVMRRRSRMQPMEKRSLRWSRTCLRRFRSNIKLQLRR